MTESAVLSNELSGACACMQERRGVRVDDRAPAPALLRHAVAPGEAALRVQRQQHSALPRGHRRLAAPQVLDTR